MPVRVPVDAGVRVPLGVPVCVEDAVPVRVAEAEPVLEGVPVLGGVLEGVLEGSGSHRVPPLLAQSTVMVMR